MHCPSAPRGPATTGHRAGPSQGRGPQPEGRTFNPTTGAKRGSNSSTSKATEFLQPRRCLLWHLGWHLVAGGTYLACYPVTWCGQWGHAHRGPKASGYVHLGCTPPQAHTGPVSLHPLSSSQRKAGAHLQQGPPLLAHSPLGRPCSHQGRDMHQLLYPDRPLYPGPLLTSSHPLRSVPTGGAVVFCSAPDTKPFRVTSTSAM